MILQGDNVRLINAIPGFDKIGDDFQVTSILTGENGMDAIQITCGYGMGVVSVDGFNQFFTKKNILSWGDWENVVFDNKIFSYRTNGKRVMLKRNGVRTSASCHPLDVFDLETGIKLCAERITEKESALLVAS